MQSANKKGCTDKTAEKTNDVEEHDGSLRVQGNSRMAQNECPKLKRKSLITVGTNWQAAENKFKNDES